jgi:hypothetical protein
MSIKVLRKMRALVFGALLALVSQLLVPAGAASRTPTQQPDSIDDLAPLPNFDVRSLHTSHLDQARLQRKRLASQTTMPDDPFRLERRPGYSESSALSQSPAQSALA